MFLEVQVQDQTASLVWIVGKGNKSEYTTGVDVRVEVLLTSYAKTERKEKKYRIWRNTIKGLIFPLDAKERVGGDI